MPLTQSSRPAKRGQPGDWTRGWTATKDDDGIGPSFRLNDDNQGLSGSKCLRYGSAPLLYGRPRLFYRRRCLFDALRRRFDSWRYGFSERRFSFDGKRCLFDGWRHLLNKETGPFVFPEPIALPEPGSAFSSEGQTVRSRPACLRLLRLAHSRRSVTTIPSSSIGPPVISALRIVEKSSVMLPLMRLPGRRLP